MLHSSNKGFTLAEVLITLGIIGIVAALTIPTLMANYQNTLYVAGLKKSYAEVTEALRLMANDHGCSDNLSCVDAFNGGDSEALGNEFKKYFKLAKDCGASYDGNTKCLSDSYSGNYDGSGTRKDMNSKMSSWYKFITADGFGIALFTEGCQPNAAYIGPHYNTNIQCGGVYIDVNGPKGPNDVGRDIFGFYITNGNGPALYPYGGSELGGAWRTDAGVIQHCYEGETGTDTGLDCAGRIIEEGWQMNYKNPATPFAASGGGEAS